MNSNDEKKHIQTLLANELQIRVKLHEIELKIIDLIAKGHITLTDGEFLKELIQSMDMLNCASSEYASAKGFPNNG